MAEPKTDSTRAFSEAWKRACSDPRPSVVYVPYGKFHLRDIAFEGPCKSNAIVVRIDGTLVAPSDYSVIGNAGNWIRFHKVDGVRISGGILDGQGTRLWSCKLAGKDCPVGTTNSKNVVIDRLSSVNSQKFQIAITDSQNVKLQRVTVTAPGSSPNTDGIHVERSSLVWILNSTISTGDDCISMGPGARNVWIERVASGVRVSGIRYKSIRGTSSTQVAVRFDCSKSNPCTGITMHDVALTYLGKEAAVTCVNARGTSSGFVTPLVRWS
ncbi:unnamed protein product [Linum tenue]|uniref:Polygalacturonase n=1 Tax=Linum tenue TaxID=586396 RepID=A0AAV0H649_9ROSI|nr:unnamed protein product [Linum tenue]